MFTEIIVTKILNYDYSTINVLDLDDFENLYYQKFEKILIFVLSVSTVKKDIK